MTIIKVTLWVRSADRVLVHFHEIHAQHVSWVADSLQVNLIVTIKGARVENNYFSRFHVATPGLSAHVYRETELSEFED